MLFPPLLLSLLLSLLVCFWLLVHPGVRGDMPLGSLLLVLLLV